MVFNKNKIFLAATLVASSFLSIANSANAACVNNVSSTACSPTQVTINASDLNAQILSMEQISDTFKSNVLDGSIDGLFNSGASYWGSGSYVNANYGRAGNFYGFENKIYGGAVGFTDSISDNVKFGYSLGNYFSDTTTSVIRGKTKDMSVLGEAHVSYVDDSLLPGNDLFITSGVTAGYHELENKRRVLDGSVAKIAKSRPDAYERGAFGQVGARFAITPSWIIMPTASATYNKITQNGFSESNGGDAGYRTRNIDVSKFETSQNVTVYNKTGFQLFGSDFFVLPHANIGLTQEALLNKRNISARLKSNNSSRKIKLDNADENYLNYGLGVDLEFNDSLTGFTNYQKFEGDENQDQEEIKIGISKKL